MFNYKLLAALSVLCAVAATAATAGAQSKTYKVKGGVTLRARAYTDHSRPLKYASLYDMSIAKTPDDGSKWDFTLENEPNDHNIGSISAFYPTTYQNKPTAILRATLHQYEFYEERVTFKNLDLGPEEIADPGKAPFLSGSKSPFFLFGPKSHAQFLRLSEPQTLVTPSGISITLPAQGAQTAWEFSSGGSSLNGNVDNLFLKINLSPDEREVILADSPLYKKHGKPVTIKLETSHPNSMVWYEADNTFKQLAISVPNLKTLKRLDSLTLILRQRVELQTIPIAIEVPVERPAKTR